MKTKLFSIVVLLFSLTHSAIANQTDNVDSIFPGSTMTALSNILFKPGKLNFFQDGLLYPSLEYIDESAPYCHASIQDRYYRNFNTPIQLTAGTTILVRQTNEGPVYISMKMQTESGNLLFMYCYQNNRPPTALEIKQILKGIFKVHTSTPKEL